MMTYLDQGESVFSPGCCWQSCCHSHCPPESLRRGEEIRRMTPELILKTFQSCSVWCSPWRCYLHRRSHSLSYSGTWKCLFYPSMQTRSINEIHSGPIFTFAIEVEEFATVSIMCPCLPIVRNKFTNWPTFSSLLSLKGWLGTLTGQFSGPRSHWQ